MACSLLDGHPPVSYLTPTLLQCLLYPFPLTLLYRVNFYEIVRNWERKKIISPIYYLVFQMKEKIFEKKSKTHFTKKQSRFYFSFKSEDFPGLYQPQLVKRILIIVNQTFTRNRRRNVNIRRKGKHWTEAGTEILDISKVQNTLKYFLNPVGWSSVESNVLTGLYE